MCVFVWMHIRIADTLQDEGTSSLGPGCRGRERMRRMEGRQRRCVFTEWHSSYSPRSSLCSSDLGTHTRTHTHNIIIIIIITVMMNTDPPVRQTAVRTACIQGLFFCLHSQLHCELLSYMSQLVEGIAKSLLRNMLYTIRYIWYDIYMTRYMFTYFPHHIYAQSQDSRFFLGLQRLTGFEVYHGMKADSYYSMYICSYMILNSTILALLKQYTEFISSFMSVGT